MILSSDLFSANKIAHRLQTVLHFRHHFQVAGDMNECSNTANAHLEASGDVFEHQQEEHVLRRHVLPEIITT
jgi:hypothetical protein